MDQRTFFSQSLIVKSLEALDSTSSFLLEPSFAATDGLAPIYNKAIEESQPNEVLVFVHDDVFLDDWRLGARLSEALTHFDVIGVAGSISRSKGQAVWRETDTVDQLFARDFPLHSGAIKHLRRRRLSRRDRILSFARRHLSSHRHLQRLQWTPRAPGQFRLNLPDSPGKHVFRHPEFEGRLDFFGPSPAAVKLLDGVFIAARADALKTSTVRFDPQFGYHFYDLDFCRQCELAGLRLGTWPIALSHASMGAWDARWRASKLLYFNKWND